MADPAKNRARVRFRRAVARGAIQKVAACIRCGASPTEAHHHNGYGDYWWDVQWLCRSCHALAEADLRAANPTPQTLTIETTWAPEWAALVGETVTSETILVGAP